MRLSNLSPLGEQQVWHHEMGVSCVDLGSPKGKGWEGRLPPQVVESGTVLHLLLSELSRLLADHLLNTQRGLLPLLMAKKMKLNKWLRSKREVQSSYRMVRAEAEGMAAKSLSLTNTSAAELMSLSCRSLGLRVHLEGRWM